MEDKLRFELNGFQENSSLDYQRICVFNSSEASLMIYDTRRMISFGLGLDRKFGYTVRLFAKNSFFNSQIKNALENSQLLAEYKKSEMARSMTFVKDYKLSIEDMVINLIALCEVLSFSDKDKIVVRSEKIKKRITISEETEEL